MADTSIYRDIEARTGGDIYIGVVGPVRTGKSTFIKKFMDVLVLPHIKEQHIKETAEAVIDQIDTMKKAILARAFRGELGTNDSSEESAVERLKKII